MDECKKIRSINRCEIAEKALQAKVYRGPIKSVESYNDRCADQENLPQHKFNGEVNPIFNMAVDVDTRIDHPIKNEKEAVDKGYPAEPINILFHTSNSEYGRQAPKYHDAPALYFPKENGECTTKAFHSTRAGQLNTALDKTYI